MRIAGSSFLALLVWSYEMIYDRFAKLVWNDGRARRFDFNPIGSALAECSLLAVIPDYKQSYAIARGISGSERP